MYCHYVRAQLVWATAMLLNWTVPPCAKLRQYQRVELIFGSKVAQAHSTVKQNRGGAAALSYFGNIDIPAAEWAGFDPAGTSAGELNLTATVFTVEDQVCK